MQQHYQNFIRESDPEALYIDDYVGDEVISRDMSDDNNFGQRGTQNMKPNLLAGQDSKFNQL